MSEKKKRIHRNYKKLYFNFFSPRVHIARCTIHRRRERDGRSARACGGSKINQGRSLSVPVERDESRERLRSTTPIKLGYRLDLCRARPRERLFLFHSTIEERSAGDLEIEDRRRSSSLLSRQTVSKVVLTQNAIRDEDS